jgi:hypothetical protein
MQRKAYQKLLKWKQQSNRKPLIVQGARQVGKTWLMKEFGKKEFSRTAYFNFESSVELQQIFNHGYDTKVLLASLNILAGFKIDAGNTLIIFDEIQACPQAVTSLKYFYENAPEYAILAAGSLLGVAIHQGISFPVGKVDFLTLYPLSFSEFMEAMGKENLLELLRTANKNLIQSFESSYIQLLRQYYFLGGMPEVIMNFIQNSDYQTAREIQKSILNAYENDFSKHAPMAHLPRIRMVWNSIVGQLAKENSKFIYSILRTGARAKDFEIAIEWLKDAGLIHKVVRVSKPGLPITAYADWPDFKIYLNDVGMLGAMGGLSDTMLLKGDELFSEFKGIVSEQFVLQQLIGQSFQAFYWAPEQAKSEVDFLIQLNDQIVPIEVKSSDHLRSRSLRVYYDKFKPSTCIRTSLAGYQQQDWMQNIPLYGLQEWLADSVKNS